jgi:small-conductance mechanosensitive channel
LKFKHQIFLLRLPIHKTQNVGDACYFLVFVLDLVIVIGRIIRLKMARLPLALILCAVLQCVSGFLTKPRIQKEPEGGAAGPISAAAFVQPARGGVTAMLGGRMAHIIIAGIVGYAADPLAEAVFNVTHLENENEDVRTTLLYGAADSISIGARAFGVVLLVDLVQEFFLLKLPFSVDLVSAAPQIGMTLWATMTLSTVKRTIFKQCVSGIRLGRVALYDKLIDFILGVGTVANVLNILSIDVGMGLKSVFAASGVSAVVFTLASKGLVEQIMAGLIVEAWDAIEEGEEVRLGDGTEGTVRKIGLVETEIVGSDNIGIRIPNTQLTTQRVSNLSHVKRSQIKQLLRFKYSDLDKIPAALDDIKREIQNSCPKLIVDGSKPFQAVLVQYEPDHVQAVINCHFNIKPGSAEYVETKQNLLLSIARAVKNNDMEFAIPSISFQTNDNGPIEFR